MTEKIPTQPQEQISPETLSNKLEVLLPPRQLSLPSGMTLAGLLASGVIRTPEVRDGEVTDMNEAYVAALEIPPSPEEAQVEFSIISSTQLAKLNSDSQNDNSWRLASALELVAFAQAFPQYVTESPLVALGQTASDHYPLAVTKTGSTELAIRANASPLKQIGTRVLIVRASVGGGEAVTETESFAEAIETQLLETIASPGMFVEKQAKCLALVETLSPEQKEGIFDALVLKLSVRDREMLEDLVDSGVGGLLGGSGLELQRIIGDETFAKIFRLVSLARSSNTPKNSAGEYELTDQQKETALRMIGAVPEPQLQRVRELIAEPDLLNSDPMNTREEAKIIFSCVNSIAKYFGKDRDTGIVSDDRYAEMIREKNDIYRLIGRTIGVTYEQIST